MACRPMSKLKRFRLVSVDKKALVEDVNSVEEALEKQEGVVEDKEAE